MAGWGTGSFENEDAQNFLGRLNSLNADDLRRMLSHAADQDYLDAPESGAAVAAAEVVAAMVVSAKGMAAKEEASSPTAPRQILDWISTSDGSAPPDLIDLARRAVEKVRTNSELKDLWLEAEGLNEWSASLRDLEARLSG
jgi:hypothetical protein